MTAHPLTWLYVPGDRPPVVAKALAAGADVVVVDLEDAVAPDRKAYARAATAELLSEPQLDVHVRVNALDTPWAADDLRTLAPLPGVSGLRLPKVTSAEDVVAVAEKTRELPCTPSWRRPSGSSGPSRSPPRTPPCTASRSARRIYGPTWAYATTRAWTGPAPG